VERYAPELVLLDVPPHQRDALTVCQRIRERFQAPIVCITAVRAEEKRGLIDLGVDEYLCKPFDADELLAHTRRVLLRRQGLEAEQREDAQVKTMEDLTVDLAHRRVLHAGHEILLTPREYRLLACLAQHAGRVVSQELLLQVVWGNEYEGKHHLLQVTINRLRRKLEPGPASCSPKAARAAVEAISSPARAKQIRPLFLLLPRDMHGHPCDAFVISPMDTYS
jgi:DNA-binding response OmpR family regulator